MSLPTASSKYHCSVIGGQIIMEKKSLTLPFHSFLSAILLSDLFRHIKTGQVEVLEIIEFSENK